MGQRGIKREFFKCIWENENKYTTYQNLWGSAKGVLRGNFITLTMMEKRKYPKLIIKILIPTSFKKTSLKKTCKKKQMDLSRA